MSTAKDRSLNIEAFIVSWPGQHANAGAIARQLGQYLPSTTIVYSDADPVVDFGVACRLLRRPNELFWTDKFTACLDGSRGDLMLVIHADCTCEDWEGLVSACLEAYRKYPALGVWAPRIFGAGFDIAHTQIARIEGSRLVIVAQTDAIVFAIPRAIIDRMRVANYAGNVYGWGIGWMIVSSAYCRNMFAAVDESSDVHHSTVRGYSPDAARAQMTEFLRQLSLPEKLQHLILESHIERLRMTSRAGPCPKTNG